MSKKKTVFIVGNPLVKKDSMPLQIMPILQKKMPGIEFVQFEPTRMDIPHNADLVFIDTVEGLNGVRVLRDISKIQSSKAFSLHDFDLGTQLVLMHKFGMLGRVKIIGVPAKGEKEKIARKVALQLEK